MEKKNFSTILSHCCNFHLLNYYKIYLAFSVCELSENFEYVVQNHKNVILFYFYLAISCNGQLTEKGVCRDYLKPIFFSASIKNIFPQINLNRIRYLIK